MAFHIIRVTDEEGKRPSTSYLVPRNSLGNSVEERYKFSNSKKSEAVKFKNKGAATVVLRHMLESDVHFAKPAYYRVSQS